MPAQIEGITAYKKNKLFAAGIPTVGELLRNYPKDYRRFEPWRKGAPIQAGDFTQAVGEIKKVSPYSGGFRFSSAARDHPVPGPSKLLCLSLQPHRPNRLHPAPRE
jgi:RecG-like helicase